MLVTLALLMSMPALVAADPPRTFEGVAHFPGPDRPAAGLTLRLFDLGGPDYVAVTDERGRFRSTAPDSWFVPQPDGVSTPCWAVAEPAGRWSVEAIDSPPFHLGEEQRRRAVAEGLARPAKATWRGGLLRVECQEPGEVEVLVRGFDGSPLADRAVEVVPDSAAFQAHGPANARFAGRTDAAGRFRMRWFEGPRRFRVTIPGEGFATTPPIAVAPGKATTGATRLPVRFGSIEGRVDPKLVGPGLAVVLDPEAGGPTPVDEAGRFAARDLPPGRYLLRLRKGNQGVRAGQVTAWVAPGRKVEGVVIAEIPPPTPEEVEQQRKWLEQMNGRRGEKDKDELWVEGTVRDTSGRPLAGADVFVRTAYDGGLRMYEDVRRTTADAQGHYAISGPVRGFVEAPVVVAWAQGRPPAVANAEARSTRNDHPSKVDLTLADSGGSATVTVLEGDRPLPGATVRFEAEGRSDSYSGFGFGFGWARKASGPERASLEAVLGPHATADQDGVARFANLRPGLYAVHAGDQAGLAVRGGVVRQVGHRTGEAHGLAVATGREAKIRVALTDARYVARFEVVRPDGRPVADQDVSLQFGLNGQTNSSTSLKLDANGIGENPFFNPAGLWTVVVRFRDAPVLSFPIHQEPYYQAEAVVPISPAVRPVETIRLVGTHRDAGKSTTLLVRLLDAEGRPARGVVDLAPSQGVDDAVAATDERGEARFDGPAGGKSFVRSHLDGPPPPTWSQAGPMPLDDAFRGRFALVLGTEVAVDPGRETTLELRARPLGYIRGTLKPANGRRAADYAVSPWYDPRVLQPNWRYEPETGTFLAGPFPAGPATLQLSAKGPDGTPQNCGRRVVEVVAGEVTPVELVPGEPEPADRSVARRQTMLGMGGITTNSGAPEAAPPTVFLPDGTTPAFAAQALLYEPGQAQPASHGVSDASGRLTWRGLWRTGTADGQPRDGLVERPTLVVSLPGRHGATIVPLEGGQAVRVVLPPAIEAEGRVTIAGRPPGRDGSSIRVVAAHQGRGVLDAALGLQTTADPDGRFAFSGLTPGRYVVQAARDGIWASKPADFLVGPDKAQEPPTLDIPAPGEAVILECVDRAGRPLADESFALARPGGPLGSTWPATLRADASGRLTLRGLEAGPHAVSIAGTTERAEFRVGEAPGRSAPTTVIRVVLQRPGP